MRYVGVDVARETLEVAWSAEGQTRRFPNTREGCQSLCAALRRQQAPGNRWQVILEPTSTYHQLLVDYLVRTQLLFTVVNPAKVFSYAQLHRSRAKTDPQDARLLARYGEREQPGFSKGPDHEQERLRSQRRHREWLREEIGRIQNRREAAEHSPWTAPSVRKSLERTLRDLEKELERVERDLEATVAKNPRWDDGVRLLTTVPGVGRHTALLILSELPPVARCQKGKQWVAYVGADPQLHQSGNASRSRLSRQGSRRTRSGLYFAGVSALRWNPAVKALGERLKAKGKHGSARTMAAVNKLLRQCFAILQSGKPYDPKIYQQGILDFQHGI